MKIWMMKTIKHMGKQLLAAILLFGLFWGVGRANPTFSEEMKKTLSTSIDVLWMMEKGEEVADLVNRLGGLMGD